MTSPFSPRNVPCARCSRRGRRRPCSGEPHLGAAYWAKGDYRQASDCLKQTVTSLHGAQRRERLGQATLPSVQSLAFLAACYAELGMFAEGRGLGEEALADC